MYQRIRKISVGNLLQVHFQVRNENDSAEGVGNSHKITSIELDNQHLLKFGICRYHIFAISKGATEPNIWKTIENMPVIVEYENK